MIIQENQNKVVGKIFIETDVNFKGFPCVSITKTVNNVKYEAIFTLKQSDVHLVRKCYQKLCGYMSLGCSQVAIERGRGKWDSLRGQSGGEFCEEVKHLTDKHLYRQFQKNLYGCINNFIIEIGFMYGEILYRYV